MNAVVMHMVDMKFKSLISDNNCSFIFKNLFTIVHFFICHPDSLFTIWNLGNFGET